ncbi:MULTISPECIES: T4SS efffector SepA family protein [unclassified Sphingopyxis]|uniref:T4SS efffector SepA family protein n=1 Tax=unclassified Sphingopyxis TaxID=2614943 RepID=UPI0012E36DD6|nr:MULTISPECIES: hypothetical protein [unclassified Sphingopyxis]
MHTHTFSSATFLRLQEHAKPFVDSIDDVVERALDALEKISAPPEKLKDSDTLTFDPIKAPSLKYTTLKSASVNGEVFKSHFFWNSVLEAVICEAAKGGASAGEISSSMQTPTAQHASDGPGYKFIPEAGISFQQLNSDRAWAETARVARKFGVNVKVQWFWQDKPQAFAPEKVGEMEVV